MFLIPIFYKSTRFLESKTSLIRHPIFPWKLKSLKMIFIIIMNKILFYLNCHFLSAFNVYYTYLPTSLERIFVFLRKQKFLTSLHHVCTQILTIFNWKVLSIFETDNLQQRRSMPSWNWLKPAGDLHKLKQNLYDHEGYLQRHGGMKPYSHFHIQT